MVKPFEAFETVKSINSYIEPPKPDWRDYLLVGDNDSDDDSDDGWEYDADAAGSDWNCSSCGEMCFGSESGCFKCGGSSGGSSAEDDEEEEEEEDEDEDEDEDE